MTPTAATHDDATLHRRVIDSPVGPLTLVASGDGLRAVLWATDDPARVPSARADEAETEQTNHHLDRAESQLREYFAGDRTEFDVQLDPVGTDFQSDAW